MGTHLIFVYGTLKRGQRAHRILVGQPCLGRAATLPYCRLYDSGRYPCLVVDRESGYSVQGELFAVDDACLARLDEYEGVPALFERAEIELIGRTDPVQTYLYVPPVGAFREAGACWPPTSHPASGG